MERKIFLVKAFTQDKERGNPAGVVLDANKMNDEEMRLVSADLGFSESAFVQPSANADYKVSFFSPKQEVAFCGHATIATFHTLVEQGKIRFDQQTAEVTQETQAGIFPVTCYKDGLIVMTQNNPEFGFVEEDKEQIASLLSLPVSGLLDHPIQSVSTGTPKLMIPVSTLDLLNEIKPNLQGIADYCQRMGTKGFYPFTEQTIDPDADFHARQFNPLAGINEDPITGVAGGALGCYVVEHKLSDKNRFIIEQGFVMGMGGRIFVEVSNTVKVGGYAVTYGEKVLQK